ncbi:hypothetical protein BB560_006388 [Smittium megazygosporum]|uniref:RING-type E3 ubiquitin transferase n=1 Tax=Smittium megazygosporum TaxID=133381 RepID=A0A2T9Y7G6_9FUNG|nr:hypothetical protein BB560_006388 [Smittium megazygosporum]
MAKKTIQDWENSAFSKILSATVSNSADTNLFYLSSTASEIKDSSSPLLLTSSFLESAILECLDSDDFLSKHGNSLSFLLNSWKKTHEIYTNLKGPKGSALDPEQREHRLTSLCHLEGLLIVYCGLSLQDDTLFSGKNASNFISLIKPSHSELLGWFTQIIKKFEDDGLEEIVENIISELNSQILEANDVLNKEAFELLKLFDFFVSIPAVSSCISKIPWFMSGEGKEVEKKSVFGPLFSISAFPEEKNIRVVEFFSKTGSSSEENKKITMNTIRSSVSLFQSGLFKVINTFVRSSLFARGEFVKWVAKAICSNIKRTGLQVDPKAVASDGFFDNLTFVLLGLCAPFSSDPLLSKIDKIELVAWPYVRVLSGYLDNEQPESSSGVVKTCWNDLTRLCASSEEIKQNEAAMASKINMSTQIGFIPDCFFLTTLAIHVGPLATISKIGQLGKEIHQMQNQLDSIQSSIDNNQSSNPSSNILLERWHNHLEKLKDIRVAFEAQSMDPKRLATLLSFSRFAIGALLSLNQLATSTEVWYWKSFPEYLLEDQLQLILFVARYAPDALMSPDLSPPHPGVKLLDDLVSALTISILSLPELVRNPYIKSRLVDVLHSLTYTPPENDDDCVDTLQGHQSAYSGDIYSQQKRFVVHPIVSQFIGSLNEIQADNYIPNSFLKNIKTSFPLKDLVMVLLKLYIDIEHTSSNSAFYDKFSVRYNIARIMRSLWNQPQSQYLRATYAFFVSSKTNSAEKNEIVDQFVSRLVSDTTYLLDESLSNLSKVKTLDSEIEKLNQEQPQNINLLREKHSELQQTERHASVLVTLTHETVHVLAFLTRLVPVPFRSESIILRFAAMLNYNLDLLAGPKCRDLKVKNMKERFEFNPKILLSELLSVYLHLGYSKSKIASSGGVKIQADDDYFIKGIDKIQESIDIEKFIDALAEDQRSWNSKIFRSSLELCMKLGLKPIQSVQLLFGLIDKVEKRVLKINSQASAELTEDVPEEFLDPIMYTLMENPVLLPTSQSICDYKTIKGYLLTDPRDPFNRKPLEIKDVVFLPELKAKIDAYKQSRKS